MARQGITRGEALRRARERSSEVLERETRLVNLVADWEQAADALDQVYRRLYDEGLTRQEIAKRVGEPTSRIPHGADLHPVSETSEGDGVRGEGDGPDGGAAEGS